MISRIAIFLLVLCIAAALIRSPRSTDRIDGKPHSVDVPHPLPLPLPPEEEMVPRSGAEVRVFGVQPAGTPAPIPTPLRIDLLIPGRSTHLAITSISAAFLAANATIEGAATDPDTGELFAWGADRSGNDIILIATPSNPLADINHDASISSDDAFHFLELFGSSHPASDLDSNGVINASDLQHFLDDFLRAR